MFPLDLANVLQAEDITVCSRNQKVLPGCERCLTTTALSPPHPQPRLQDRTPVDVPGGGAARAAFGFLGAESQRPLPTPAAKASVRLHRRICWGRGAARVGTLNVDEASCVGLAAGPGELEHGGLPRIWRKRPHLPCTRSCLRTRGPTLRRGSTSSPGFQGLPALPKRQGHEGTPSDRKVLIPFLVSVSLPISLWSPVVLENQD